MPRDTPAIVHQQQIGMERNGQSDGCGFALMDSSGSCHNRCFGDLKPNGRRGDPALNRRWRTGAGEFGLNDVGKDHSFTHAGKQVNALDEDQVIDGAGIGDDQAHYYRPRLFRAARSFSKSSMV